MEYLEGYSNRFKLTIASGTVSETLYDYPILINLSSAAGKTSFDATNVFDELTSNDDRFKIALTTTTSGEQCPIEIEYWDSTEEKATLWAKVPTVYASVDTELYFYYDATTSGNTAYVGEPLQAHLNSVAQDGSVSPWVIYDNGVYKMWYGLNSEIYYKTSTDKINWSTSTLAVAKGSQGVYDVNSTSAPSVIKDGTTYHMLYTGVDSAPRNRICYCNSTDGITWSNFQLAVDRNTYADYDWHHVYDPCMVKVGSTIHLLYTGIGNINSNRANILYRSSTNYTTWSSAQVAISSAASSNYDSATFIYDPSDSKFKMWCLYYTTGYVNVYKESYDCIGWGANQAASITGLQGAYDTTASPPITSVLITSVGYDFWYYGTAGAGYSMFYFASDKYYPHSPSEDVWNSEYRAVYHMNYDPSGIYSIKDSTSYRRSARGLGSMTLSDLINGVMLEFDGVDDAMGYAQTDLTNNFMFSAKFYATTTHEIDGEGNSGTAGTFGQHYLFDPNHGGSNAYSGLSVGTNGVSVYEYGDSYVPALAVYSATIGTGLNNVVVKYENRRPKIYLNGALVRTGVTSARTTVYAPKYIAGNGSSFGSFAGRVADIFLSTNRSDVWIAAEHSTFIDDFITFGNTPSFKFDGYVKVQGTPVARTVHLIRRADGKLVDTTISSAVDGYFALYSEYNEYHFVVILPTIGDGYNLIAYDQIHPAN